MSGDLRRRGLSLAALVDLECVKRLRTYRLWVASSDRFTSTQMIRGA